MPLGNALKSIVLLDGNCIILLLSSVTNTDCNGPIAPATSTSTTPPTPVVEQISVISSVLTVPLNMSLQLPLIIN